MAAREAEPSPKAAPEAEAQPAAPPARPTLAEHPSYIDLSYPDGGKGPAEDQARLKGAKARYRPKPGVWRMAVKGEGLTPELIAQRRQVAQELAGAPPSAAAGEAAARQQAAAPALAAPAAGAAAAKAGTLQRHVADNTKRTVAPNGADYTYTDPASGSRISMRFGVEDGVLSNDMTVSGKPEDVAGRGIATEMWLSGIKAAVESDPDLRFEAEHILSNRSRALYDRLGRAGVPFEADPPNGSPYTLPPQALSAIDFDAVRRSLAELKREAAPAAGAAEQPAPASPETPAEEIAPPSPSQARPAPFLTVGSIMSRHGGLSEVARLRSATGTLEKPVERRTKRILRDQGGVPFETIMEEAMAVPEEAAVLRAAGVTDFDSFAEVVRKDGLTKRHSTREAAEKREAPAAEELTPEAFQQRLRVAETKAEIDGAMADVRQAVDAGILRVQDYDRLRSLADAQSQTLDLPDEVPFSLAEGRRATFEEHQRQARARADAEAEQIRSGDRGAGITPEAHAAVKSFEGALREQSPLLRFADFEAVAPRTDEQRAAVEIGRALGRKVTFFRASNTRMADIAGAVYDGHVLINAESSASPMHTVGHEVAHTLRNESPDLYKALRQALDDPMAASRHLAERVERYQKAGIDLKGEKAWEEFAGDFLGEEFTRPEFWRAVNTKNPSLGQKLLQILDGIIAKVRAAFDPQHGVSRFGLPQLERARDVAASVIAEQGRRAEGGVSPSGMFPGEQRELPREAKRTRGTKRLEGTPLFEGAEEEKAGAEKAKAPQGDLFGGFSLAAEAGANEADPADVEAAKKAWQEQGVESPWFKRWIRGSVVQEAVYHQTSLANEKSILEGGKGFDLSPERAGARRSDEGVPDGIFLKPTAKDIGVGAARKEDIAQMPLYVRLENPLVVQDRLDLRRMFEGDAEYDAALFRVWEADREFKPRFDRAWDQRRQGRSSEDSAEARRWHEAKHAELDQILDEWKTATNAAATSARARLTQLIRERGHDGVIIEQDAGSFGRRTKTLIALEPTQVKSTGNRGTFDPAEPDIRLSIQNHPSVSRRIAPPDPASPQPEDLFDFHVDPETRLAWLRRKVQDRLSRLEAVEEQAAKRGEGSRPESAKATREARLYIGKASDQIDRFNREMIDAKDSFTKRLMAAGFTVDDLGVYLYAEHAAERNEHIAEINEDMPDGGSGMSTQVADEILDEMEGTGIGAFAAEARRLTVQRALKMRLDAGLISQESYDTMTGMYPNYVPLKGKADETAYQRVGKGFSTTGTHLLKAKGRKSLAGNPFLQMLADYQEAVIASEKNKVGQAVLELVERNPSNIWTVDPIRPVPLFDSQGNLQWQDPKYKLNDNVVGVHRDGQLYLITITDESKGPYDPKKGGPLAEALKNLDSTKGLAVLRQVNSYLRLVNTTLNPEFLITNFERDLQMAGVHLAAGHGSQVLKEAVKNTLNGRAIRGVLRSVRDGKATEESRAYDEMKAAGGKTGWFDTGGVEERTRSVQKMIEQINQKGYDPRRALRATGQLVNDLNEAVESGVRLATYMALRKRGVGAKDAALVAKNLTVNFNDKGSWGTVVNTLYLFSNASIQGTANIVRRMGVPGRPKTKGQRIYQGIVGGVMAAAFANSVLCRLINPDDWEDMSDWDKDNYWHFPIPKEYREKDDKAFVSVKLPYGLNIFAVLGRLAEESVYGDLPLAKAGSRFFGAALDAFSPLQGGSISQFLAPTFLDPLVQMGENKQWHGGPIWRDQPKYGPKIPEHMRYFDSVRPMTRDFTAWLNRISGGKGRERGAIDVNPEAIDFLTDILSGGTGRFVTNAVNTAGSVIEEGSLPDARNVPVVRQFLRGPNEWVPERIAREAADESGRTVFTPGEVDRFKRALDRSVVRGAITEEQRGKFLDEFATNQARAFWPEVDELYGRRETVRGEEEQATDKATKERKREQRLLLSDAAEAVSWLARARIRAPETRAREIGEKILAISREAATEVETPQLNRARFATLRRDAESLYRGVSDKAQDDTEVRREVALLRAQVELMGWDSEPGRRFRDAVRDLGGWERYYQANRKKLDPAIGGYVTDRLKELAQLRARVEVSKGEARKDAIADLNRAAKQYGGWPEVYRRWQTKKPLQQWINDSIRDLKKAQQTAAR
ncbi:MAG: hypothetical protein KKF88_04755 [Alphaproteobacteria bacterium]|nr:hypothetical protein [Alphaproteobacteria bacterium]